MLAYVSHHLLERIVKQKWTHVHQIDAKMLLNVPQVQTIKTFIVHAQLATLEDFATKISMSVSNRHRLVEMERLARILTVHISAFAQRDMKERIVQLIPMIALPTPVKMEVLVLMESVTILACALMDLKANTAKKISMSVYRNRAKMEPLANNMSTPTRVHVLLDFLE
jgi:hypothetical protein